MRPQKLNLSSKLVIYHQRSRLFEVDMAYSVSMNYMYTGLIRRSRYKFMFGEKLAKILTRKKSTWSILRDFRNAPFYIHCLFHMINLMMFSSYFFIFLHNGPWFAMILIRSCYSFWRNTDVSVFQQLLYDKCEFDSIWKQILLGGSQMSYQMEKHKSFQK